MSDTFRAIRLFKTDGGQETRFVDLTDADLGEGDVTVSVQYSTVNYKDGLALTGKAPVVRVWPMTPGIDFSGVVESSSHPGFKAGDAVVLNGWGLGETHQGGYAGKARVRGDWLVKLPSGISAAEAMAIGTAGYTAMLSVMALEREGVTPDRGDVIVTGAAGGVGKATAERLLADGVTVIAADRDRDRLEVTVKELGPDACAVTADVAEADDWHRLLQVALDETGGVDLLVNNAGIEGPITSLAGYPEADFRRVLDVNVVGVFLGMKTCAAALAASGRGSIVNVASVSGLGGQPSIMGYVASKHAVIGMTKSAALELAGVGVRVNAVCPSPVETDMIQRLASTLSPDDPELVHRRMREAAPLGRYAQASEVAAAIAFLASDEAAYLTGVALPVDGGSRAR